jgi:ABC-type polar amino acid transport system, ATPase component
MIEVKNIIKSFEGRAVLNNISAVFEQAKTNLIIGRSGSGKTGDDKKYHRTDKA